MRGGPAVAKLTSGCSRSVSRSLADTDVVKLRTTSRARSADGADRNRRPLCAARSRSSSPGAYDANSSPIATPATVGCTPEAYVASHSSTATTTYGAGLLTRPARRAISPRNSSAAIPSAPVSRSSV